MKSLIMFAVMLISMLLLAAGTVGADELVIHCINIGQGDCTLIESPSGKTLMFDAGPPYNTSEAHLCNYLDSIGASHLDYFMVSHYQKHHVAGIDTIVKHGITIDTVYDRGLSYCKNDYTDKYIPAIDSIRHTIAENRIIDLGGGVNVRVVSINGNGVLDPPYIDQDCDGGGDNNENDFCIALVVDYHNFQFFVGGDLPGSNTDPYTDIETSVAPKAGQVEVYRVNHHGSRHSTNEAFLTALDPVVSVISVGANDYGHPDTSVVRRLEETSVIYQTQDDEGNIIDGDIVIRTPGYDYFTVNGDYRTIASSEHPQYYHPFQNFDDDVDHVKRYYNFFGGNSGIQPPISQLNIFYDTLETRSGYGRSLRIEYDSLTTWSMYVESFNQDHADPATSFDLTDLFPDYADIEFQGRGIDSLVFYCKLAADNPLTLKLELHDTSGGSSDYSLEIDTLVTWQHIAAGLDQFSGTFNPSYAKYLGLTFADYPDNLNESGRLYVDDFYLVENDYEKPEFAGGDDLLDYLNKVSFRHFWMAVDSVSKFAWDRDIYNDLISVDAIGFQLSSYVIAHRNGWITPSLVEDRVEHILDILLHRCAHASDTFEAKADPLAYATVNGIWAHFLDYETLSRKHAQVEYSLFTNALLLSGVLVCKEHFSSNSNIVNWADTLFRMADWNFLYVPDSQLMRYGWLPESGYLGNVSDWFTEELDLVFLLAISAPDVAHRIPANPYLSSYYYKPCCCIWPGGCYTYSAPGANFTYYFLQMYAQFAEGGKDHTLGRFEDTRNALLADLKFCQTEYSYLNYDSRIFGTTACEGPDSAGEGVSNYHAYGYPCRYDDSNAPNGTVAVYGSGAATLFIPDSAIACLSYYYDELDSDFMSKYGYSFWSPIFGFPDAFHLAPDLCIDTAVNSLGFRGPWLSVPRFGIDIGPMLMNIDSYLAEKNAQTSVRDLFSQNSYVADNIAQFEPIICAADETTSEIIPTFELYQNYPNPFNPATVIRYDLERNSEVVLKVYNILGQEVRTLVHESQNAGEKAVIWNGRDNYNIAVSTGVYFYSLEIDNQRRTKKLLLLR